CWVDPSGKAGGRGRNAPIVDKIGFPSLPSTTIDTFIEQASAKSDSATLAKTGGTSFAQVQTARDHRVSATALTRRHSCLTIPSRSDIAFSICCGIRLG